MMPRPRRDVQSNVSVVSRRSVETFDQASRDWSLGPIQLYNVYPPPIYRHTLVSLYPCCCIHVVMMCVFIGHCAGNSDFRLAYR